MYNNQPRKTFDNGGVLFPADQKRQQNSPDFRGNIKINREMLDYLIDQMEGGGEMTLTLFGYNRQGNKGRFIGLSPAIPMQQDERPARQVNNGYQQQGRSYQRPQQNAYREQSGGGYGQQGGRTDFRQQRPSPQQREANEQHAMKDFQRGDRLPDFGERNPETLPWED
jgi:hypothetical protein